jgi:hypothetical protein
MHLSWRFREAFLLIACVVCPYERESTIPTSVRQGPARCHRSQCVRLRSKRHRPPLSVHSHCCEPCASLRSDRRRPFRWFTHGCAVLQPTGYFQASRWDAAGNQFHLAIAHDAFLIELQRLLWRCAGQLPQSVRLASLRLSIGPQASIPVVYARLRRAPTDRLLSGIPLRSITTLRCKRGLSVSQWNRADFSVEPATVLHSAICRVVGAKHLSP